jgi:hypothetical protein
MLGKWERRWFVFKAGSREVRRYRSEADAAGAGRDVRGSLVVAYVNPLRPQRQGQRQGQRQQQGQRQRQRQASTGASSGQGRCFADVDLQDASGMNTFHLRFDDDDDDDAAAAAGGGGGGGSGGGGGGREARSRLLRRFGVADTDTGTSSGDRGAGSGGPQQQQQQQQRTEKHRLAMQLFRERLDYSVKNTLHPDDSFVQTIKVQQ